MLLMAKFYDSNQILTHQQFSYVVTVDRYQRLKALYVMPQNHCIVLKLSMNSPLISLFVLVTHISNEL